MNDLKNYFLNNNKKLIYKWEHYFDIYDEYFSQFRNKEVVILEIGVFNGGSLQMWKNYFGDKAKIYGIDIDPRCKNFEEDGIEIFIGSQTDRKFLNEVKLKMPDIDILIDDGGHTMKQQITTLEEMFEKIKDNGIYLCEDLQTSYYVEFGGGLERNGTFIEFSKKLIDHLNAFHYKDENKLSVYSRSIASLHFYESILIIKKNLNKAKPLLVKSGISQFPLDLNYNLNKTSRLKLILFTLLFYPLNLVLNRLKIKAIKSDQMLEPSIIKNIFKSPN